MVKGTKDLERWVISGEHERGESKYFDVGHRYNPDSGGVCRTCGNSESYHHQVDERKTYFTGKQMEKECGCEYVQVANPAVRRPWWIRDRVCGDHAEEDYD